MGERDLDHLRDVAEHGEEALAFLNGVTLVAFRRDRRLQLATERLMEIIGEAASRLSPDALAAAPYDWKAVRGLCDVLAHQYGSVDKDTLYASATRELPKLVASVRGALSAHAV